MYASATFSPPGVPMSALPSFVTVCPSVHLSLYHELRGMWHIAIVHIRNTEQFIHWNSRDRNIFGAPHPEIGPVTSGMAARCLNH